MKTATEQPPTPDTRLTWAELQAIKARAAAQYDFLAGEEVIDPKDLSEMARLAVIDVPRLVAMCELILKNSLIRKLTVADLPLLVAIVADLEEERRKI